MGRGLIVVDRRLGPRAGPSWAPSGAPLALVANRPVIAHAVDALRDAGADGVAVVADRLSAGLLREALEHDGTGTEGVAWVELESPVGEGEAILAAAGLLGSEHFLLHRADGVLLRGGSALRSALAARACDAALFFRRRRPGEPTPLRPRRGVTAALREAAGGDAGELQGVHVFGPAILDALRALERPGGGGERRLTDALDRLAADDGRVIAGEAEGWWQCCGSADDLLVANREALDVLDGDEEHHGLEGSRIEGRVRIHPDARVSGAVIRGPVLIGARARVADAYVGPYTSIAEDAVVENAEVECSIVLPGACMRNVGLRIEASIIGRGATVTRDFRLPRALRLLVGEGSQITLS